MYVKCAICFPTSHYGCCTWYFSTYFLFVWEGFHLCPFRRVKVTSLSLKPTPRASLSWWSTCTTIARTTRSASPRSSSRSPSNWWTFNLSPLIVNLCVCVCVVWVYFTQYCSRVWSGGSLCPGVQERALPRRSCRNQVLLTYLLTNFWSVWVFLLVE